MKWLERKGALSRHTGALYYVGDGAQEIHCVFHALLFLTF